MNYSRLFSLQTESGRQRRRKTWPVIRRVLRDRRVRETELKEIYQPAYLDGQSIPLDNVGRDLIGYLLCHPQASKRDWTRLKRDFGSQLLEMSRSSFMDLQTKSGYYFNTNTLFSGKEEEVYSFFFEDVWKLSTERSSATHPATIVTANLFAVQGFLSLMHHNPFSQVWREIDQFQRVLELSRGRARVSDVGERHNDIRYADLIMFDVAFICRYRSLFPDVAVQHAQRIECLATDADLDAQLTNMYERVVEEKMMRYAGKFASGGRLSFAIKFPDSESMEAAYALLFEKTRYPNTPNADPGVPMLLPRFNGMENEPPSFILVNSLWQVGFRVDAAARLDDQTLCARTTCPLRLDSILRVMKGLCDDMTSTERRIRGKNRFQNDYRDEATIGKGVYCIEPVVGPPRVGTLGYRNDRVQTKGFNSAVKRSLSSLDDLELSMRALLSERARIYKSGR